MEDPRSLCCVDNVGPEKLVTGSETSDVSEADEPRPSNLHQFRNRKWLQFENYQRLYARNLKLLKHPET
jgi:hypothetical protein